MIRHSHTMFYAEICKICCTDTVDCKHSVLFGSREFATSIGRPNSQIKMYSASRGATTPPPGPQTKCILSHHTVIKNKYTVSNVHSKRNYPKISLGRKQSILPFALNVQKLKGWRSFALRGKLCPQPTNRNESTCQIMWLTNSTVFVWKWDTFQKFGFRMSHLVGWGRGRPIKFFVCSPHVTVSNLVALG